jgi:hypothetical protein
MWHEWERRVLVYVIDKKARGKEPLGGPRCKWVDNIKMDLL